MSDAAEPVPARPPNWLPVLTDVIERGVVPQGRVDPVARVSAPPVPGEQVAAAGEGVPGLAGHAFDAPQSSPQSSSQSSPQSDPENVSEPLVDQLMSELGPRLSELLEKEIAASLRHTLDETIALLLSQLEVHVREIVREVIAEKLDPPSRR